MESWDILDGNGNKRDKTGERGKPMGENEYHPLRSYHKSILIMKII